MGSERQGGGCVGRHGQCLPLLGKGCLHSSYNLVHFSGSIDIPVSTFLTMKERPSNNLYLQDSTGVRSGFTSDFQLTGEFSLKFLLDLAELGGVTSSTAIGDVYFQRHLGLGRTYNQPDI